MTSHSQSNHYYNNENDALSCNSRPISSTLHRKNSNEQYKNNADIYSYSNTNIYDTTSGIRGSMDTVMHRNSNEPGSDPYVYNKDVSRDCVNTYGCDINILLQSGATSTKSTTTMPVRSNYNNGSGYSFNDNLINDRIQVYNSYTNDMYKNEGAVNSTAYCHNTPLSTISGDNTVEYNHDSNGYTIGYKSWGTTSQPLPNDEYASGRHKSPGSTKVLPRIPIKQRSWNEYDDKEMQAQCYDANMPLTTSSMLPLQTVEAARIPHSRLISRNHFGANEIYSEYASAATCSAADTTVSKNVVDVGGGPKDLAYSGSASLRLLPQLHPKQEYGNVFHRQIADDDNTRTELTSATTTSLTTSTNMRANTYDNSTIIKNYGDIYDDPYYNRPSASTVSKYNGAMLQQPYASLTTQSYMEYDGYNTSYNNAYNNSNTADNLSTCSDKLAYSAAVAQKLQLQQQRKYAIMMAMTTASVIASGETRVPVKRVTESDALTDIASVAQGDALALKAQTLGGIDALGKEADFSTSSLWARTNEGRNNKVATKSAMLGLATTTTTSKILESTTHLSKDTPTTLTLTTSTRKLPKRLPTPKPKSSNNNSNCHEKANGSCKKLPKLPIDKESTAVEHKVTVVQSQVKDMRDMSALEKTISVTEEASQVQTSNAIVITTTTFPPLALDTLGVATTTCVESIPASSSTESTSTSSSTLIASYSPSYIPYMSNVNATKPHSNASIIADNVSTTTASPTAAKKHEAVVDSTSYISIYNNNNTVCKYDFAKDNSNSNCSSNYNNNNSVIVTPTTTERKLSVTTIPTNIYPLYLDQRFGYTTNSGGGNIADSSVPTFKHTSVATNAYDSFLQTKSCTSSNSPLTSPSTIMPSFTCSTVSKPTSLLTHVANKELTSQCSSHISPIVVTTLTTLVKTSPTTSKSMLFSAYSSDKIHSLCNVKPSYSLSTSTDVGGGGDEDTKAASNDAYTLAHTDKYNLNAKCMFDTTMSNIYEEYFKNAGESYLISSATILTTLATLATATTLTVTSGAPTSTCTVDAKIYDIYQTQPYAASALGEMLLTPTTATTLDSSTRYNVENDAKLQTLPPETVTTSHTIGTHVTCSEDLLQNGSHSIITTTPTMVTTNNNVGRLLTTTVDDLANISVTATMTNAISIADIAPTTTTTTYTDYLAKYPLPAVLMTDGSSSSNNNVCDRELPSYMKEFLNCDTKSPNLSDSLSKYDAMLQQFDSLDAYKLHTTTDVNFTSASEASVATVMTTAATVVSKYDCTTLNSIASGLDQYTESYMCLSTTTTNTTTTTTTTTLYSDDSITFSYPTMATILNDNVEAVVTTAMPASATVPSLTSTFDDSFYDSYNVDWSSLATHTTIDNMNAEPLGKSTQSGDTSAPDTMLHKDDTKTSAARISTSGGTQGGYYRPSITSIADSTTRKNIPPTAATTSTVAETTSPPTLSVTGKTSSMFGGISKGLKDGLDGVLSSVNTTSETDAKPQQPKKSGFGFALASKFVPNVGGLFAGTTAPTQQTSGVVKPTNGSASTTSLFATTTTAGSTTANADATMVGNSDYGFYGSTTATTAFVDSYAQQYSCDAISKYSEPLYTNCHGDNMNLPFAMSDNATQAPQLQPQADDMITPALHMLPDNIGNNGNNDGILYLQPQEMHTLLQTSEVLTSEIATTSSSSYSYSVGYDVADVARVAAMSDAYGNAEYNKYATAAVDDMQNVSYGDQISDKRHVGVVDGSIINTTAYLDNDMATTYYHTQQQINSKHTQQQQQQQTGLSSTSLQTTATCAKKSSSSLFPGISNLTAGTGRTNTNKMPTLTAKAVKPSTGSGGGGSSTGGMFGSFLGKAAAAVQSATQAVNQATTSVQQKAATVIPSSTTETAVTTATTITPTSAALMHSNDSSINQQQKMISHQDSMSSSHYSVTTTVGEDYDNRNLYSYKNSLETTEAIVTTDNSVTVTDTEAQQYNNYYLHGNQQQQQQSCKLLPSVPTAGSTGKKLPTINSSKSGFLIKQQPTEIYDDDLIIDLVNDTNEYHLDGFADENSDLFDDDETVDELNDNNLSNIDDVDNELDRYIVDDRIGRELCHKQQSLQQIQPNYEIDSEQANYYTDNQLQETPSDVQQSVSQHHQRHSAANSYYEHTDGGYDYREDYFNEEDEYKYLEKEQEIIYQQQQQNLLKQKKQQKYQYEDTSDIYLEDNYQSEDSGNYLDESSSSSVVGGAKNALTSKQQPNIQIAETPTGEENDEMVNALHTLPTTTADNFTGMINGNVATLSTSSHQHQIKKQDSIIMEEDEDILRSDIGVNSISTLCKEQQPNIRRSSHESIIENDDDIMCELPSMPVAAPKKKMLIRGETEEVVGGHLHMLRKAEVSAKQRWHWAYNKIIMQLNNLRQSQSDQIKYA